MNMHYFMLGYLFIECSFVLCFYLIKYQAFILSLWSLYRWKETKVQWKFKTCNQQFQDKVCFYDDYLWATTFVATPSTKLPSLKVKSTMKNDKKCKTCTLMQNYFNFQKINMTLYKMGLSSAKLEAQLSSLLASH